MRCRLQSCLYHGDLGYRSERQRHPTCLALTSGRPRRFLVRAGLLLGVVCRHGRLCRYVVSTIASLIAPQDV